MFQIRHAADTCVEQKLHVTKPYVTVRNDPLSHTLESSMDASAVNWNVTIDDFDSLLTYDNQGLWQTPDPSIAGFDPTTSPWLSGTYHNTTTVGASVSLNITGE